MKLKTLTILILLIVLGFFLRIYRLGAADFKEDEHFTIKAAAYQYYCRQDNNNCRYQPTSFNSRLKALIRNNETKPNLLTEIYFWDFASQSPTLISANRAWPHSLILSRAYSILGISEFSSRIVSVIAGSLLMLFSYFLSLYFSKSRLISLVYTALIATSFPLIEYSRHARMYSLFILVFPLLCLLIYQLLHKRFSLIKFGFTVLVFLLAYWLHLLTLILPVSLLIYTAYFGLIKKHQRLKQVFLVLFSCLFITLALSFWLNINFFHSYFFSVTPVFRWQYFRFILEYPLPAIVSAVIIIPVLPQLFKHRQSAYLLTIILTYSFFLTFFSQKPAGSAYIVHLLPLTMLLLLMAIDLAVKKTLKQYIYFFIILISVTRLILLSNYLYYGRDDRPRLQLAYQVIKNQLKPDQQILGIQVKDYYLQNLPVKTPIINLAEKQALSVNELLNLLNQSSASYIVWEKEKFAHFQPEVIELVKTSAQKLAGEGLDDYGVEIYYLEK